MARASLHGYALGFFLLGYLALFFSDSGLGKAVEKTKALMPNCTLIGELALPAKELENKEETKRKITEWCNTLKTA